MRNKIDGQPYLEFRLESSRKVVREYLAKYEAISQVLDDNPQILDRAHEDFKKLSERGDGAADNRDRSASYTSENLLRALIVLCVEQESYRDCVVRIDRTDCLKQFCRLGPQGRDILEAVGRQEPLEIPRQYALRLPYALDELNLNDNTPDVSQTL